MPLNLNDKNESPDSEPSVPEPLLHKPRQYRSIGRTVALSLFGAVVLASVAFLVYIVVTGRSITFFSQESAPEPPADTTVVHIPTVPPQVSGQNANTGQELRPSIAAGKYTVYIGSLVDSEAAAEEVGRWVEAGYKAYVVHANEHYRIALGQYASAGEAKESVKELKEAFEYGFWIGAIE